MKPKVVFDLNEQERSFFSNKSKLKELQEKKIVPIFGQEKLISKIKKVKKNRKK